MQCDVGNAMQIPTQSHNIPCRCFGELHCIAEWLTGWLTDCRMKQHGIDPAAGVNMVAETIGDDEFADDHGIEDGHGEQQQQQQQQQQGTGGGDTWDGEWDSSDWGESGGDPSASAGTGGGSWDEEVKWTSSSTDSSGDKV
jgi:hypothetical protein